MTITRPQNISLIDWTDQVALDYPQIGVIPKVHSESEWQEWAARLLQIPLISRFNPPDPYRYDDWRTWGELFCEAITI